MPGIRVSGSYIPAITEVQHFSPFAVDLLSAISSMYEHHIYILVLYFHFVNRTKLYANIYMHFSQIPSCNFIIFFAQNANMMCPHTFSLCILQIHHISANAVLFYSTKIIA